MQEFKDAIEALEKSGSKQTAYWNILSAVSFGAIGIASSGHSNIVFLILGYLLFGLSNLQAVDGFQKELLLMESHLDDLISKNGDSISETQKIIFRSKKL